MNLRQNAASLGSFLATFGLAVLACIAEAAAQEPTPPQVGLTARCYFPGTIVLSWSSPEGVGATIFRSDERGGERELSHSTAGAGHYYDTGLKPGEVFRYRVKLNDDRTLGPVAVSNSPEMLVDGDFEGDELGAAKGTRAFHQAYGEPWWEIVELPRPGSPGHRAIKIAHGSPPRRDGLHSKLLPIDPRSSYRQSGWQRVLLGSNARIGRRIVNREMKPAGGRIVAYSYASVVIEKSDGWQYCEQRLTGLPKDAAFIQVWALAFNSRNSVWFDDLSLVDERVERLAKFDSEAELPKLAGLAAGVPDASLQRKVEQIRQEIPRLETALRSPKNLPLEEYLDLLDKLDRKVGEAIDVMWDLKILGLAK